MSSEKFSNFAKTTLAVSVTSTTATSITVSSTSYFPTSPQFHIVIDSEIMIVTSMSGSTWTVIRGTDGSTAATHTAGVVVVPVLTKGSLNQMIADNCQVGTTASLPASEKAGRLYLTTDGYYQYRDTGSAWQAWGPLYPMTPPPAVGSFTWVNQGSATAVETQGGLYLSGAGTGTSGDNLICLVQSLPVAPYTYTVGFKPNLAPNNYNGAGICLRDSSSGKIATHSIWWRQSFTVNTVNYGGLVLQIDNYSSTSAYASSVLQTLYPIQTDLMWFRITDDGTNRTYSISTDAVNFARMGQVTNTNYLTPNQLGFFINTNVLSTFTVGMTVLSYVT